MFLGRPDDRARIEVDQVRDERIGMLGRNAVRGKRVRREIPQVAGDDHVGPAANGSGQHMPVARVRQVETADQAFEMFHQTVTRVRVHELACPLQLLPGEIGAIL